MNPFSNILSISFKLQPILNSAENKNKISKCYNQARPVNKEIQ